MPGGVEELLEAGSGIWGGDGGAGKPDNVAGRTGFGGSACLRWLFIFS